MQPLLLEMARARDRAPAARAPGDAAPPARRDRRRAARARGALRVAGASCSSLLADMTAQPRLADARRAARATSCASPPLRRGAPRGCGAIPGRIVPLIDAGLAALEAGRTADAVDAHPAHPRGSAAIAHADRARRPPNRVPRKEHPDERLHARRPRPRSPSSATAMQVVYQWNYDSEVEELRRLYVKAAEAQWVAERDLDWDRPIDLREVRRPRRSAAARADRAQRRTGRALPRGDAPRAHPPHGGVPAEQLPARRAGRAHGGGAARERGAAHRRQVLRRDADDGRGAARRGVRALHREARRAAADRARR